MVKPIALDEVRKVVSDDVIEAFNTLIQENWNGHSATILQREIVSKLPYDKQYIYDKGMLDVEDLYREQGWIVEYDNSNFEAYFKFTKGRK